jgi:O-methyltransferase
MTDKFTVMDDRIYGYLLAHQAPEHEQLRALRERSQKMPDGRMQITPEQGHFLALLVRLTGARRVLEVGTFTGYSALAMALALSADGNLVTCDIDKGSAAVGMESWRQAGVAGRIDLRIAPALQTLQAIEENEGRDQFDLVFIDADKPAYEAYYERALRLVRQGGLIALDNMLRRGRVADSSIDDPDTVALRQLNTKIAGDERVDRVLLPIASGMTLARRR